MENLPHGRKYCSGTVLCQTRDTLLRLKSHSFLLHSMAPEASNIRCCWAFQQGTDWPVSVATTHTPLAPRGSSRSTIRWREPPTQTCLDTDSSYFTQGLFLPWNRRYERTRNPVPVWQSDEVAPRMCRGSYRNCIQSYTEYSMKSCHFWLKPGKNPPYPLGFKPRGLRRVAHYQSTS